MFILYANKNQLTARKKEPVTSGSVNAYRARFEFSADWTGLTRKAVFRGSGKTLTVLLDEGGECVIPWEVLTASGQPLMAGVFGTQDETALPTIWSNLGTILEGVPGDSPGTRPPTPDLWEQELDKKGDALDYDGLNLSLMSGDKPLSTVQVTGGGGVIPVPGPQGPPGPQGEPGPQGPKGDPGNDATINGKNAITLAAGDNVSITTGEDGTVTISSAGGGVAQSLPAGCIVIWAGAADAVPDGWALCDGQDGRPDLRDKFVLGAGTTHAVGETGGSETVTLTVEQMPSHAHELPNYYVMNSSRVLGSGSSSINGHPEATGNFSSNSGESQPHPNMPPYYALCYIIKL